MEGLTAQEIMAIQQDLSGIRHPEERCLPQIITINDKKAFYECYFASGQLFQFFYINEKGELDGKFIEYNVNGSISKTAHYKNNKEEKAKTTKTKN